MKPELPTLTELRAALPSRCLEPSTGRSLAYFAWDLTAFCALAALAWQLGWSAWLPLVWFAQGTLLWALFVIGHDCGHGSFSRRPWLNDAVGHVAHTLALVPYHAWQHSHRVHHRFAGHLERDEGWFPYRASELAAFPAWLRFLRFRAGLILFPLYLVRGTPGRPGNHFAPASALLAGADRARLRRSYALCAAFAALLALGVLALGPGWLLRVYGGAYCGFAVWISLVTWLHHSDPDAPWYRGEAWSPLRGAFSTLDRRYGPFDAIHHRAGWHTAHHLFPGVPHYRLVEATAALEPLLARVRRPQSRPLRDALARAARCQVVSDEGDVVFARPYASGAESRPATR